MKTESPLTVGQFKKWCIDNNILDNTPIGVYLGDSERGDVAFCVTNLTETTGEHCYFKNVANIFDEAEAKQIVMITDGCHSEEI